MKRCQCLDFPFQSCRIVHTETGLNPFATFGQIEIKLYLFIIIVDLFAVAFAAFAIEGQRAEVFHQGCIAVGQKDIKQTIVNEIMFFC